VSKKYPPPPPARGALAVLRAFALSFPDSVEEFPWGHRVMKVRGKMFVIFGGDASSLNIAVKLPTSNAAALALPNCEPTPYGIGSRRSGRRSRSPTSIC
jgi:YjbR